MSSHCVCICHSYIDAHELTYLLVQYSLPPSDVQAIMSKYGGADARLSFNEFKRGFRPLILFQLGHLKENLKEMEREEKREQLRTTYVRNKSRSFSHMTAVVAGAEKTAARIAPKD